MNVESGLHRDEATSSERKRSSRKVCSVDTVKKVLPILKWLPKYSAGLLIQDIIAGITVGLTAIPQGIAYAVVAGLSPEYGLYAGLMGGFVYLFFGSCKDVTVGPTAIMAALTAKYVSGYSEDFAVLAAFLAGLVELAMGILNLGFLVEFISMPVISGFTTAAALQIASSQLKALFGLASPGGNFFAESVYYFVTNIQTATIWDPVLGFLTIAVLVSLKYMGQGCSRSGGKLERLRWFLSLARNAVVVILGIIIAFIVKVSIDDEPMVLIGDIGSGLPTPHLPPFTTVVGNETYNFTDMTNILGPEAIVLPLVAILESVAIAKAFASGGQVDASQEMIALGLCNVAGSFMRSMPITGSFTRTALNNASGVQTPAGGIFTGLLIILALTTLTSTFYYIPKASLAGLIITAMFSMIDFTIFKRLWANKKRELLVSIVTIIICSTFGLEYGIVTGIVMDAIILLYSTARPRVEVNVLKAQKAELIVVPLSDSISYCAAEHVRRKVLSASIEALSDSIIIVDGTNLKEMDMTVATNLMSIVADLEKRLCQVIFLNFKASLKKMCTDIKPQFSEKFVSAATAADVVDVYVKNV